MSELSLTFAPAPHARSDARVVWRMRDMLLALTPVTVAACCFHGADLLLSILAALAASAVCQALFALPLRRRVGLQDLSFAVTGVMAVLLLPASAPVWAAAVAAAAAQLLRALFGGLGRNFLNPALFGAALVTLTGLAGPDALHAATEVTVIAPISRFIGCATLGPAGSCSALLLCLGWLYLLAKDLARPLFSLSFLAALALPQLIFGTSILQTGLLGPALLLALYCGSDSVTTPIFRRGQLILGAALGLAAAAGRIWLSLDLSAAVLLLGGPLSRALDAAFAHRR